MADSYGDNQTGRNFENSSDGRRGFNRGARGRESGGGFRIRLSDNEMRAVRSIQETFKLRSTVAVLGFAIRTLAQMLEEGKLTELVSEYRSQSSQNNSNNNKITRDGRNNYSNSARDTKPNPFARPLKPEASSEEPRSSDNDKSGEIEKPVEETNIDESENSQEESINK